MYTATRKIGIDAGHRVPMHDFQCSNLHGHRYTIEATIAAEQTVDYTTERSDAGMLVDFGVLKDLMMEEIHDKYDHKMILWEADDLCYPGIGIATSPREEDAKRMSVAQLLTTYGLDVVRVPVIPTAEELARLWYLQLDYRLSQVDAAVGFTLSSITVHETPNNRASFDASFAPPGQDVKDFVRAFTG